MPTTFRIKHLSGSLAGRTQKIALKEGQTIRLGRSAENDVKFTEAGDDNVSGVHAELVWQDGRLYVEDKKSTNGTFVNGSRCPAFERMAVPDGARVRLAQDGPEMEVTFEPAAAAANAGEPPAPPKAAVGRETLLREIDRARQEERDHLTSEVARTRKSTGVWFAAASVALALLVVASVAWAYWKTEKTADETRVTLERQIDEHPGANVWTAIEARSRPAVGHVRVKYRLTQPHLLDSDTSVPVKVHGDMVTGSAVLIGPGLVITAKHVAEPWKYLLPWDQSDGFADWDEFAEELELTPVYDRLEIQFPGHQPISATYLASAETSDLALLSIPPVAIQPMEVERSNEAVHVTDEIAVLGYPYSLGALYTQAQDVSYGTSFSTEIVDMEPTFIKGTVSRPVSEIGETSRYFFLDGSIERGNSGGPVLNRVGRVIGIISMKLEITETFEINGKEFPKRQEVESAGRAVGPADIADFLTRAGVS